MIGENECDIVGGGTEPGGIVIPSEYPVTDYSQSSLPMDFEHTGVNCDICGTTEIHTSVMYCPECMQKLCPLCTVIHNDLGGTRGHRSRLKICWPEGEGLPTDEDHRNNNFTTMASQIRDNLGIQVCVDYDEDVIELRAPTKSILDVALSTVQVMKEPIKLSKAETILRIKDGCVEWVMRGRLAITTMTLFKENLKQLEENWAVEMKGRCGKGRKQLCDSNDVSAIQDDTTIHNQTITASPDDNELVVRTNFNDYENVSTEMEGLIIAVKNLPKAEILRPKHDEFRMRMYAMVKEASDDIICFIESLENIFKLVIIAREEEVVENVKQEFLSLFCKECSSCHEESQRPTYLECKHVLCLACATVSACNNDGLRCPVCNDKLREKTPLLSLQLKCIQVIDQMTAKTPVLSTRYSKAGRKTCVTKPQTSIKIPRYLLNNWKKSSGGIQRLKSLIENTYGLHVTGSDDNLKIYGHQSEILELAVQTLETMNTHTKHALEIDIRSRIVDKSVEWRFHGDFARISHFLFNKELYGLKRKFRTVTIQSFTETVPNVLDVKCGYSEYMKVKYEIEELVNDLKSLYTDECIQPRNFFFNEKVRDFVQVKHRDNKVHCTRVEKNNLNVVTIRGRRKEYVQSAKEELLRWS